MHLLSHHQHPLTVESTTALRMSSINLFTRCPQWTCSSSEADLYLVGARGPM